MKLKYGQIAGNNSINAMIYHCFEYIHEADEREFVKKFEQQPHDSAQIMHTFRELVLGGYLSSKGFNVRYDYVVEDKTPDWSILDTENQSVRGLVELTSFHIDKVMEQTIKEQMQTQGVIAYWRDQYKDNLERLYHAIWRKTTAYASLVEKVDVPYVVGLFGEFTAIVDSDEVSHCLFDDDTGLFDMHPELSGVLYFEETGGGYSFDYASNPNALQSIELPIGVFSSGATAS